MDSKVLPQQSSTTKSVSASEIPKVMQFLESKSNNRLEFLVDDSNTEIGMNRSHEENLTLTTTLTDQIKMVTNSYGKSNYTFELIEQGDKNSTYFLNLVVKEYKDEMYMYIVKYVPDTTWLEAHHMIKDFNVFTGSIYFYSENGTYVGKSDMASGIATSGFQKNPCDDESSESENTNNGSSTTSSNNGTTGGNSGGLDCYPYLMWYECNGDNSDEEHSSEECGGSSGTGSGWTLVIVCQESFRDLQNVLRHPCDGGSNGGGASTSSLSCETITGNTCDNQGDILMEWDENCNCVEAETIENSETSVALPKTCEKENFISSINSPFNVDLSDVLYCDDNITTVDDEKFMCIYEKLEQSSSFKNLFIDTFGEENNNLNVTFELTENLTYNGNSVNGLATRQDYTLNEEGELLSIEVKIQINKNLFSGSTARTPFQIARTIIHESIHAYLYLKIINCEQGSELLEFDNLVFNELLNMYFESSCSEPLNQHDFMFDYMLPTMQTILSEIKDDILPENQQEAIESTDFYDLSQIYSGPLTESTPFTWEDFYFYLSTNGLSEANFYNSAILSDPIKLFLRNHYHDELTNLSKNCYE